MQPALTQELEKQEDRFGLNEFIAFKRQYSEGYEFISIAQECEPILGLSVKEVTKLGFKKFESLLLTDVDWLWEQVSAQCEAKGNFQISYQLHSAFGEIKYMQEMGFKTYDPERQAYFITGFLQDVSAQKTMYEGLKKQKLFYESTLNKMPVELAVLDVNQRYLFISQAAIKDENIRQWLIGKNDLEYARQRGKDTTVAQRRQAYLEQAIATKQEIEWEENQKDPQGKMVYSLRRYSPIVDQNGEILIIIGYGFNISDRKYAEIRIKENEMLLRSINTNVQEGIFRFDLNRSIVYANDAFIATLGCKNLEGVNELLERMPELKDDLFGPEEVVQFTKEFEYRNENGPLNFIVKRNKVQNDASTYYDGILVNVTSIKDTERELIAKNKDLEKAYMELDRFVYSASHDLRAPLTSVMGIVKIAFAEMDTLETAQFKEYLEMIKTTVSRLDHFIQEIIHYYRNNRIEVSNVEIKFDQVLDQSFENLQYMKEASHISFTKEYAIESTFYSDPGRIQIILNNLIANAIKYHDKTEGGWIRARIETTEEDSILISIEDNGPGIGERHITKIFDMFYRAGIDKAGSGLGLYIVGEAVKKLGGKIWVDSTVGKGSTFFVKLPNNTPADEQV